MRAFLIQYTIMKLNGINGKGTGKLGSTVYAINSGVQIVREYNNQVANPNTQAQVEIRSGFKLLSQLSAALKADIAIKKDGLKTARNQFMGINKSSTVLNQGIASINLNRVQLTKSNRGMSDFSADRSGATAIAVSLDQSMAAALDKVVFVAYTKELDGSLIKFADVLSQNAGDGGNFAANLPYTDKAVVIFAYGLKVNTEGARVAFGNMLAPSSEQVAKLLTTSSEVAAGTTVTMTKALTMLQGEDTGNSDSEEHFRVAVSVSGNGSVAGGGSFVAGQRCTLVATPDEEATFVAYKKDTASGQVLSTNETYAFDVTEDVTIVAVFQGGASNIRMTNVTIGGQPWNAPKSDTMASCSVTGDISNADSDTRVIMVAGTQPSAGDTVQASGNVLTPSNGSFTGTVGALAEHTNGYLCAVKVASGSNFTVESVWPNSYYRDSED